jgi:pyridoxine 4-dehydrogenase
VTVIGYSPIGRGFLTGQFTKPEDIPENDFRRRFTRFAPEVCIYHYIALPYIADDTLQNFDHNLKLVHAISAIAERKGATPAQLAIAWVSQLGPHVVPLPGSSKKERTIENLGGVDIQLSPEELQEIDEILNNFSVKGGRYVDAMAAQMFLWG